MKRRQFLKPAGVGLAASAAVASAGHRAVDARTEMAPDGKLAEVARHALFGACETFANMSAEATDNKFQIQTFAARRDRAGACRCSMPCRTAPSKWATPPHYYYIGKDPTWALFCSVPFGLNARQQNAWFYEGEAARS